MCVQQQDEAAQNATSVPSGINRLRKRPNLVVTERPRKAAQPQVPINRGRHLLRRPGLATPSTPEPKATSAAESEEETAPSAEEEHSQEAEAAAPSSTTTSTAAPEPSSTESRLSSLIKKRRKPGQHYNVRSSPPSE